MSVIAYTDALTIEQVYLVCLTLCSYLNRKNRLFSVSLLWLAFALFSSFFLFDFLYETDKHIWTAGWILYLLTMMALLLWIRFIGKEKMYLTDIILLLTCFVQIAVFGVTYITKVVMELTVMNGIYSATAPTMYVIIIIALSFPSIYKKIMDKYYGFNNRIGNNSRGSIYIRWLGLLGL